MIQLIQLQRYRQIKMCTIEDPIEGTFKCGHKGKTYPNLFPTSARMSWRVGDGKGRRGVTRRKAMGTLAGSIVLLVATNHRQVERMTVAQVAVHRVVSAADPGSRLVRDNPRKSDETWKCRKISQKFVHFVDIEHDAGDSDIKTPKHIS